MQLRECFNKTRPQINPKRERQFATQITIPERRECAIFA